MTLDPADGLQQPQSMFHLLGSQIVLAKHAFAAWGSVGCFANPSSMRAEPSAKWYHAAFHSITAMVGAGILALPYSFSYLTWSGGIISLMLCTSVSLYCSHLLAEFHEGPAPDRIRYNRYRDVGRAVLGLLHHFTKRLVILLSTQSARFAVVCSRLTPLSPQPQGPSHPFLVQVTGPGPGPLSPSRLQSASGSTSRESCLATRPNSYCPAESSLQANSTPLTSDIGCVGTR